MRMPELRLNDAQLAAALADPGPDAIALARIGPDAGTDLRSSDPR
jgi:hypothetical protein